MNFPLSQGSVIAVCKKTEPGLPKLEVDAIQLIKNYGVEGDYHAGEFVRHRYLAKKDPTKPNLRQVLLIDTKILADITTQDIHLEPGMLGENMIIDGNPIPFEKLRSVLPRHFPESGSWPRGSEVGSTRLAIRT